MDTKEKKCKTKKKWNACKGISIDQEVSRRCRDCLKTVFQEMKNTDMNAIKHATQPRIQTSFWTLKNISQQ